MMSDLRHGSRAVFYRLLGGGGHCGFFWGLWFYVLLFFLSAVMNKKGLPRFYLKALFDSLQRTPKHKISLLFVIVASRA